MLYQNVEEVKKMGGSLTVILTPALKHLGIKQGDLVKVTVDIRLGMLTGKKVIIIETYKEGEKPDGR